MVLLKHLKQVFVTVIFMFFGMGVIAQNSQTIITAFEKSYKQEKTGNYKQAAETLKKVYSEDSYELSLRIGWLSYNAGLFDESAAYYRKAVSAKPFAVEAKFGLIYPLAAQGNWSRVEQLYQEILVIAPKNTTANYRLGLIYYGQKEYSKALKHFQLVADLYPFDYDALLMCAWTNYFLGNKREAKVYFNKTLMNNPGDKSALEGLSLLER